LIRASRPNDPRPPQPRRLRARGVEERRGRIEDAAERRRQRIAELLATLRKTENGRVLTQMGIGDGQKFELHGSCSAPFAILTNDASISPCAAAQRVSLIACKLSGSVRDLDREGMG